MSDREWKQADQQEIEKFGDVRPPADRYKTRHLQPTQPDTTPEILARREAKEQFKIKRVK